MNQNIGKLQDLITKEIIKFEKEYLGRGPEQCKTFIIEDMVIVRLSGILTKAEQQLCSKSDDAILVKQIRIKLIENSRNILEQIIYNVLNIQVKSIHTDLSTKNDERIIVFILEDFVKV